MILTHMIPEQEMIFYAPGIPGTYWPVRGAACVHAEGKFGSINVDELTHEAFTIQLSDYDITQYAVLKGIADKPLLELQVALLNSFRYRQRGMRNTILHEGRFNMMYAPAPDIAFTFDTGHYLLFTVRFSVQYLLKLEKYFPVVTELLQVINNKQPGLLRSADTLTSDEVTAVIYDILYNDYNDHVRKTYVEAKMLELFVLVLQRVASNKTPAAIRMRPDEVQKIHKARAFLEKNIGEDIKLSDIAHYTGLNEFKLKQGFRQLYDTTPFEYLLDCRMQEARSLLQNGTMSLGQIALAVGYTNVSGFTVAFKKKMGYAPADMMKGPGGSRSNDQ